MTAPARPARDLLPPDEWELLRKDCRAYAKSRGVPDQQFEALFNEMWRVEADPATSTWDPKKKRNRRRHLFGRFRNVMFADRVRADNNHVPLVTSPDDPVYRSVAAEGATPEREAAMRELLARAPALLEKRLEQDDLARRILALELKGVTESSDIAKALDLPVGAIYDGRDRLKRHRDAVARELQFKNKREMFAAGVPETERKVAALPARNGAVWTWVFAASWVLGVAACAALVLRGWNAAAAGAAVALAVLVPVAWTLWLRATWRAIPPQFRKVDGKLLEVDEAMRLLVRRGSIFRAMTGLCEAVDFAASPAVVAPAKLVRVACWMSVPPAIVVAPVVWFVAMRRIDAPVAKGLRDWKKWVARDGARFGGG